MNNDSTAANTEEADNVIFLQGLHGSEPADADAATDSAIFYQLPQSPLEKRCSSEENEAVENQNEYARRHQVDNDVQQRSRTQLKELYPGAYSSWKNVKQRCKKGKGVLHPAFDDFADFLQAVGPRPADKYTVDRIDNSNPEYSPDNCRWASKTLQTTNRKNTRILTDSQGTSLPVSGWSRRSDIPAKTILQRIDRDGWTVDDAIRTPVNGKRSPSKSQDKPSTRSLFPDAAPAHLQWMLDKWTQGLEEHHHLFFLLEYKHFKALEYIREGLYRCDVSPGKVVEFVVDNWYSFAVEQCYSHYSQPAYMPDLNFLKAHIMEAVEYYLFAGGTRLSEDYPDQFAQPAAPGEFDDVL